MRHALLIMVIALAAGGCGRKPPAPAQPETPASVRPKVTVLQADILVIEGKHYRLANGFAPQSIPDARCWAEALASREATRVVAAMVDRAGHVEAIPTGPRDEYDRLYATIHIDGADLGQMLYDQGLAARPKGPRFAWCDPISRNEPGAPPLRAYIELSPGSAAVH